MSQIIIKWPSGQASRYIGPVRKPTDRLAGRSRREVIHTASDANRIAE